MNNWQLDKNYMKECINKGKLILKNDKLSNNKKRYIKRDIQTLQNFLNNEFVLYEENTNKKYNLEKLKELILNKMKKQYKILGEELINWIIYLDDEEIFEEQNFYDQTELTFKQQVELTLKNYEQHSKFLLEYAKQIIYSTQSQIQLVEDLDCSSYCYYLDIIKSSFLIIDPSEFPWILNHELQHAIENNLNLNTNVLFTELGPIYFELLFNELLYNKQNFINEGDYKDRLNDIYYQLDVTACYFKIMKIFAKDDFNVSLEKFQTTFFDYKHIMQDYFEQYLIEEVLGNNIELDIGYLLSFLKAVELKEKTKNTGDVFSLLREYIKYPKFNFKVPKDSFKIYKNYIKEMKQKTKTM